MAILTAQNLSVGYGSNIVASDISFSMDEGDYLCIVGENGAGKTTLMRTILGLQEPLEGKILMGEGMRKEDIGYLPQQTMIQRDFPASVEEIVLSGCQGKCGMRPFYSKKERNFALMNMERMDIADLKKRSYRELSGGQQQRVLLARALCAADRALLLDEPVAGLDPNVTEEMYALIQKLNRSKMTIIMISHDLRAVDYASHILRIGEETVFGKAGAV
ncbi:MAG: ABC transporter ATP-binding protein [Lachnospiraceae bacterium]|nr:ABC transporter ATP-binding protein [Lachnospiraceae bacterium]